VVIHAIDPRGMETFDVTAADNTSRMSARRVSRVPAQREQEMVHTQEGMFVLAEETGGLFLHDANDLSGALRKAADDSDNYYLIGYHPDSSTFENSNGQPKFHKLEVRVKRTGLHVRSRDGFFGEPGGGDRPLEHTREAQLNHALQSPYSAGSIHPRLTAVFSNLPKTGSFINAYLSFQPQELKWSGEPDGSHKASIDIAAAAFDENGQALGTVDTTFPLQLNPRQYAEAVQKGMVYGIRLPIARPGPYLVRAALRDPATEGSGSAERFVEVPDVESGHLALSSLVLQDAAALAAMAKAEPLEGTGPGRDMTGGAARRSFPRGGTLVYSYEIMNAKADASRHPDIEVQTRLFRAGEQVLTHKTALASAEAVSDPQHLRAGGRLTLGSELTAGEYILQVIVTDKLAPGKFNTTAQSMDFRIEP